MASIHKRSPRRVVVDRHIASAAVFDTLEQAVAFGFVRESRKVLDLDAGTALVERVPEASWDCHCL